MSQPNNMTRLEVVDVETLEVKKAIYLAGHNAQEIQAMSDSLLRNLNTFQFFVRAVSSPSHEVAEKVVCGFCKGTGDGEIGLHGCTDCNGKGYFWEPIENAAPAATQGA